MPDFMDEKDRNVIPRWRRFQTTLRMGELSPLKSRQTKQNIEPENFEEKVQLWNQHGTDFFANELMGCALSVGRESEATAAAEQVLASNKTGHASKETARRILGLPSTAPTSPDVADAAENRKRAASLRLRAQRELHNPFVWVDLARAYENLGVREKAGRNMRIALSLAPNNRFVLRSAATLYYHHGELDMAHRIIKRSSSMLYDPWLLSAEIAFASKSNKTSQNVKVARRMLETERFPEFHMSELASALGTLEANANDFKKARKLFHQSLAKPTENAVAQAAWAQRYHKLFLLEHFISSEALAFKRFDQSNWDGAIGEAHKWWDDQPFSAQPLELASYSASLKGSYPQAIEIADRGLIANPRGFTLLNNKTVYLARIGKPDDAQATFDLIEKWKMNDDEKHVWLATFGLLEFRRGKILSGRAFYKKAIDYFSDDPKRRARAYLNYAMEEINFDRSAAPVIMPEVQKFAEIESSDVQALLKRVTAQAETK